MKKILILLSMAGLLLANEKTEKKASDFVLKNIRNQNVRLSESVANYKLTIINFWATWCMPCRAELKALNKIYKNYQDKGINIISISVDDPKTAGRVKSFARANRIKHDVWLDTNNEIMRQYNVNNPPYTLVVDSSMTIFYEHSGYRKGDIRFIKDLLDEQLTEDK